MTHKDVVHIVGLIANLLMTLFYLSFSKLGESFSCIRPNITMLFISYPLANAFINYTSASDKASNLLTVCSIDLMFGSILALRPSFAATGIAFRYGNTITA